MNIKPKIYKPVIGLEVHIELNTKSKMFCRCDAFHFGKLPNTNTCPTCLGLPGAMPYPNKLAINNTLLFGLSLGCKINNVSRFDRKHYFYPDLPKGYQISQYDLPFCKDGVWFSGSGLKINIKRVHLEEDTGKLQHILINGEPVSLIDFNRSGVPLLELVTDPNFFDVETVLEFLKDIQLLAKYLNISNADMEKGSMRLEANISLQAQVPNITNDELPDYKVELKNINSFKFLKIAILYEMKRQSDILSSGMKVIQETRGFDEKTSSTYSQRIKEGSEDYRYFPEPDIPTFYFNNKLLNDLKKQLTETPWKKRKRFIKTYGIKSKYAEIITSDIERSDYFEELCKLSKIHKININLISDLIINKNMDKKYKEPQLFILEILKSMKKVYFSEEDTLNAVIKVLSIEKNAVQDYKTGKLEVLGYLIGSAQKLLTGKGDVALIRKLIIEKYKRYE